MGTPFENPVVQNGTGSLVIPQIQSPNFNEAAKTGWAIQQDGDAFFFNITAAGNITASSFSGPAFLINSAGVFVYSGTPAHGNLIISAASSSGTDAFGNAYDAALACYAPGSGGGDSYSVEMLENTGGGGAVIIFHCTNNDWTEANPVIEAVGNNTDGAALGLSSGAGTGADEASFILADSIMNGSGESGMSITSGSFSGYPVLNPGTTQTLDGADFGLLQTIGQLGFLAQIPGGAVAATIATKVNNLLTELINQGYMASH